MSLFDEKLKEWTKGNPLTGIFYGIRDIPYAIIPELNTPSRCEDILSLGRGSCSPKHFLMGKMYGKLGIDFLYIVYPFRWDEVEVDYPPSIKRLAKDMPLSYHLACLVDVGKYVLVDATLDLPLRKIGLHINEWDGRSDTELPIKPSGEPIIYHPSEVGEIDMRRDERSLIFYDMLNRWLEEVRNDP